MVNIGNMISSLLTCYWKKRESSAVYQLVSQLKWTRLSLLSLVFPLKKYTFSISDVFWVGLNCLQLQKYHPREIRGCGGYQAEIECTADYSDPLRGVMMSILSGDRCQREAHQIKALPSNCKTKRRDVCVSSHAYKWPSFKAAVAWTRTITWDRGLLLGPPAMTQECWPLYETQTTAQFWLMILGKNIG